MNNIKKARLIKGLAQKEVAATLSVSQPTVSAWEAGTKAPNIKNLQRLSELLDVSTDYLLGNTDHPTPQDTKKEASPSTDREALRLALRKAGILPTGRDLTDEEYALLFGAAKAFFEEIDK